MHEYIERVIDLTDPNETELLNLSADEARQRMLSGSPESVRDFDGSFALIAKDGKSVKLARSLDRPLRYFLAKQIEGPALIVAHRIDSIQKWLEEQGFGDQFHPYYTRMVPAHYLVSIQLVGCPDPDLRPGDAWALGIVLFELLTLRKPFEASNQCDVIGVM